MSLLTQLARTLTARSSNALVAMPQTRAQTASIIARGFSAGEYVVEHDPKKHKFLIKLDSDNNAFIDYEQLNNNEVLLYHTEVPKSYGGKGIGKILAEEAFNHFEKSGQKMVITCMFLQKLDQTRQKAAK